MLSEEFFSGSTQDPLFLVVLLGFLLQRAAGAPSDHILFTHMPQSLVPIP